MSKSSFGAIATLVALGAIVAVVTLRPAGPDFVLASADEAGTFGFDPGELVPNFSYSSLDDGSGTLEELLGDHHDAVVARLHTDGKATDRPRGIDRFDHVGDKLQIETQFRCDRLAACCIVLIVGHYGSPLCRAAPSIKPLRVLCSSGSSSRKASWPLSV